MDNRGDIKDEIDRSFGSGPDHRAGVVDALADGRRALLRRRLTVGAGALATVAVIGGTTWAATGTGEGRADDTPVASNPGHPSRAAAPSTPPSASPSTPPSQAGRTPTTAEIHHALDDLNLVMYSETGKVVIDPRATVVDRIDNPFDLKPPSRSVGVAVKFRGAVYWFAQSTPGDGSSSGAMTWSGSQKSTFAQWVVGQSGTADDHSYVGDPALPGITYIDLVEFSGDTEKLRPVEGATILEQRPHVSVGDSFAGPNDHTAVAEVKAANGDVYYVLARSLDGKSGQYIAVPKAKGGATIDGFLEMARTRYAEGGGGLL